MHEKPGEPPSKEEHHQGKAEPTELRAHLKELVVRPPSVLVGQSRRTELSEPPRTFTCRMLHLDRQRVVPEDHTTLGERRAQAASQTLVSIARTVARAQNHGHDQNSKEEQEGDNDRPFPPPRMNDHRRGDDDQGQRESGRRR